MKEKMGNIVLLDDLTINKIAAGEVIERPASVVKELVENSIDAGARSINVEIKNGGISYIRITDNGKGIAPDDMEIAFERHATSKIRKAEDLEVVTSMGFRGEALASVAAISKIEMVSKSIESEIGYKIQVEGGNILNKEEAGCPQGTTITIKDLFYNTPVRYKFLKKDYTEAGYIEDVITRIALVHPEIAIRLINSGKTIIQTPGNGDSQSVIYSIYGKDVAENILKVDYTYEDITVTGVVGKPIIARSNRANQLFFLNKRYIKDKTLTSAAEQGFKGLITIGKYGFVVLNLKMDPKRVDVNVHPAKLEVRFEEESKVFKAVYHAIKDTLLKGDLVADTEKVREELGVDKTVLASTTPVDIMHTNKYSPNSIQNNEFVEEKEEQMSNKVENGNIEISHNISKEIEDKQFQIEDTIKGLFRKIAKEKGELEGTDQNEELEKMMGNFNRQGENLAKIYTSKFEEDKREINDENNRNSVDNDEDIQENEKKETTKENESVGEVASTEEKQEDTTDIISEGEKTGVKETTNIEEQADTEKIIRENEVSKEQEKKLNFDEMYMKTFGAIPSEIRKVAEGVKEEQAKYTIQLDELAKAENLSIFPELEKNSIPNYKFIGIAFSTYIILELDKELYILDQHAAHERIMYEKVKKNYYSDEEKDSQLMLLPDIINLSHKEMDIAKENMEMFRKAGFTLDEFGENTIKLSGVPNICIDLNTKEMFLETLDEINTVARTAKQEKEEKFIATVACKAAVKANMALSKEEVDNLMEQLLVLPNPFTCPHGRPTAIRMTKTDIEKKFERR